MARCGVDPYRVLGVEPAATDEQMQAAYRRLARELHPDTGSGDGARMAEVNAAWEALRHGADVDSIAVPRPRPTVRPPSAVPVRLLRMVVVMALGFAIVMFVVLFLVGFGRVGS